MSSSLFIVILKIFLWILAKSWMLINIHFRHLIAHTTHENSWIRYLWASHLPWCIMKIARWRIRFSEHLTRWLQLLKSLWVHYLLIWRSCHTVEIDLRLSWTHLWWTHKISLSVYLCLVNLIELVEGIIYFLLVLEQFNVVLVTVIWNKLFWDQISFFD
mgnify:CR=1 FL=1